MKWLMLKTIWVVFLTCTVTGCLNGQGMDGGSPGDASGQHFDALDADAARPPIRDGQLPEGTVIEGQSCNTGENAVISRVVIGPDGCPSAVEVSGQPRACDCVNMIPCCEIDPSCQFPVSFRIPGLSWVCGPALIPGDYRTVNYVGQCYRGRLRRTEQPHTPEGICSDCAACFGRDI